MEAPEPSIASSLAEGQGPVVRASFRSQRAITIQTTTSTLTSFTFSVTTIIKTQRFLAEPVSTTISTAAAPAASLTLAWGLTCMPSGLVLC